MTASPITLTSLADQLTGEVFLPGDPGWDQARTPWNVAVDQHPAAVVLVEGVRDVVATVEAARTLGLRVAVQGTGHNAAPLGANGSLADTILLRTTRLRDVTIDPATGTARAEAGALWGEVTAAAAPHGLAALAGSSPDVGVAGYTLGGGLSWLARAHGLAANHVRAIELVTADGTHRRVDAATDPDLFWALRGGGGNFGVVTAIEFGLLPITDLFAGALLWPVERAAEVVPAWRQWVETVPEEVTSVVRVLNLPPLPLIPEPLRGRSFVAVEAAILLDDAAATGLLTPLRALGPAMDTFHRTPITELAQLHMDPPEPVPAAGDGVLLADLDDAAVRRFVDVTAAEPALLSSELRHLGGALAPGRAAGGAVSGLDARFLLFTVGIAPSPEAGAAVAAAAGRVKGALAPQHAATQFANFRESRCDPAEMYGQALERLRAVRSRIDPEGLFRGHHPVD